MSHKLLYDMNIRLKSECFLHKPLEYHVSKAVLLTFYKNGYNLHLNGILARNYPNLWN